MDPEFWKARWDSNQIGFHEGEVNRMLAGHMGSLGLAPGATLFLPLCGKTRDIAWLRERGYRITGAELSGIAVSQLFEEMALVPEIVQTGPLRKHSCDGVEIFEGNIFDLTRDALGAIDAVFDRAALVALPLEMRDRYVPHIRTISDRAPQLLVTLDYDQSAIAGPPFSISEAEVLSRYGADYEVGLLANEDVVGGIKGCCPGREKAWLLKPRRAVSR